MTLTEKVLTGVGAALKREREAAGLAVADVAERLKLLPRQIESLEHERFERLPGPAIARGMVRNYARLLELDPEPLLERMAPRGEEAPERGQIAGRRGEELPSSSPTRPSTLLYVGFSVAVLVLIGAFGYVWQRQEKAGPEFVMPERTAAVTEAPPAVPQAPPTSVQEPAESEKSQVAKAPDEPKPQAAAQPALPPGVHRLVLRMEEEAWIEVRDGTGRSLVSSLNAAGTERIVRGRPPFELVVGNAAHVKLTYDGDPVDLKPHIRGEVARLTLK